VQQTHLTDSHSAAWLQPAAAAAGLAAALALQVLLPLLPAEHHIQPVPAAADPAVGTLAEQVQVLLLQLVAAAEALLARQH
jgi:hypothetical protein